MLAQLLTLPYLPFSIALVVMVGIGLIEAIGLGLGHLDIHGGTDVGAGGGVLDWLGLGNELPVLIWLTSLFGCFTLVGIAIQQGAVVLTGTPLPWTFATVGASVMGVLLNTAVANGVARVMPRFETSVISTDELLGQRGVILEGTAYRGVPVRAKVVDHHGQAHIVMVEPHDDADALRSGETVLLVRREGRLFLALMDRHTLLRSI